MPMNFELRRVADFCGSRGELLYATQTHRRATEIAVGITPFAVRRAFVHEWLAKAIEQQPNEYVCVFWFSVLNRSNEDEET